MNRGQTLIYGVQVIPPPPGSKEDGGTGWRGTVQLINPTGALIATPTQRLVYYDNTSSFPSTVLNAVVYPVLTASGGSRI